MSKTPFIQLAATVFLPNLKWDVDAAINYAERLWQRLGERGYSDAEKPRAVAEDSLEKLPTELRKTFERFWAAFAHKEGKQRAAMCWGQVAPDTVLAERIIDAARQEARRPRKPTDGRKPAAGWLSERGWEDYVPVGSAGQMSPDADRTQRMRALQADISGLERLISQTSTPPAQALFDQLINKREALKTLMEATDDTA